MGKPFIILRNFLGEQFRSQLLDHAVTHEHAFDNSWVGNANYSSRNDKLRMSKSLENFGDLQARFNQQVLSQVPSLCKELGLAEFEPAGIESEIIAHNDGDFFKRHVDTFSGTGRSPDGLNRLITLVYYFFREPRRFSGGELGIYPVWSRAGAGDLDDSIVNFSIEQDSAIVFSSIFPHEVHRVTCPSGQFADSRFSVNTWVTQAGLSRHLPR